MYKLVLEGFTPVVPVVEIIAPSNGSEVCVEGKVELLADVYYPEARSHTAYADLTVPSSAVQWTVNGAHAGTGLSAFTSLSAGSHNATARAFGDPALSRTVHFTATSCVGHAPAVTITSPAADMLGATNETLLDGYDSTRQQWYKDVYVSASATDVEDGTLGGTSLVWTTDQTAEQAAVLGTGATLTVRLYATSSSGLTHTLRVTATDSDGNSTTSAPRKIYIWTLN